MITNTYYHYCSNLVYNNDRLSSGIGQVDGYRPFAGKICCRCH